MKSSYGEVRCRRGYSGMSAAAFTMDALGGCVIAQWDGSPVP